MKEFEYFQSLPLYLVANAFKLGLITSEEKRKMKQIIIANSPEDKFFINDMIMDYNKNGILDYIIFDEVIKDYDEELYKVYSKYVNIYSNIEVFNDYEDVTYGYENIDNLLNRKLTDYTTNTHHFNMYDIDAERVGYKEDSIKARSVNLDLFRYIKLSAKKY